LAIKELKWGGLSDKKGADDEEGYGIAGDECVVVVALLQLLVVVEGKREETPITVQVEAIFFILLLRNFTLC